jgi:hypothetical protein
MNISRYILFCDASSSMCWAGYGCKVIDVARELLVSQQINMWYNSGGMDVQWNMSTCQGRQNPKASYVCYDDDDDDEIYVLRFEMRWWSSAKGKILLQQFLFHEVLFCHKMVAMSVASWIWFFCQFAHMCCCT